jgi:hypothetical protein
LLFCVEYVSDITESIGNKWAGPHWIALPLPL